MYSISVSPCGSYLGVSLNGDPIFIIALPEDKDLMDTVIANAQVMLDAANAGIGIFITSMN